MGQIIKVMAQILVQMKTSAFEINCPLNKLVSLSLTEQEALRISNRTWLTCSHLVSFLKYFQDNVICTMDDLLSHKRKCPR